MLENRRQKIIERIFSSQNENGLWHVIDKSHKYYPDYLHYVPNYRASLWVLIMLADLKAKNCDEKITEALNAVKSHLFDSAFGIYSLKSDHFPIPCLNGNILYLDTYFNGEPDCNSLKLLSFFNEFQRFDDGIYNLPKNEFCSNKSCYGKHTCYWGVVKLLKGISYIPGNKRNNDAKELRQKCIDFILKHKVCYSSKKPEKIMINKIDFLTFPNMYKSDFLEILWLLKRENIKSGEIIPAVKLLKSKQTKDNFWMLERNLSNLVTRAGEAGKVNYFVSERANEVLEFYNELV